MNHASPILIILVLALTGSCERMSNKGHKLYDSARQMAGEQAKSTLDKVFPRFDPYIADSEFNRQRFEDYLKLKPGDRVKNIYAFGDFLGIDYMLMFAFECDSAFAQKIIQKNELSLSPDLERKNLISAASFDWWPKDQLDTLPQFKKGEDDKYWKILWLDSDNQKAYYLEYSI